MKGSGCFAAVIGLIAASTPSFAGESGGSFSSLPQRLGLAPLFSHGAAAAPPTRLETAAVPSLPALETVTAGPTEELPCSLQTLSGPELLAPPPARPSLLSGRGNWRHYPSLGGPALTLTSPESLPSLRDPAAAPADPEDTLRLLRSRW